MTRRPLPRKPQSGNAVITAVALDLIEVAQ